MRVRLCCFLTLLALCSPQMQAQALTGQQASSARSGSNDLPDAPTPASTTMLQGTPTPVAQLVAPPPTGTPVTIHAQEQEKQGDTYHLRGEVEIDYLNYILRADRITYNAATGDVDAQGHLQLDGGPDNEEITATHGQMNLNAQTGRFYDVVGSVGVLRGTGQSEVYSTPNPFRIAGKLLVKNGPESYALYGGSMTSCRLPKPNWRILAPRIIVANGTAKAWNSHFTIRKYPIFYLPYVTHAVDASGRQSGILIPTFGTSSIQGYIFGEAYYWAINRSSDLMLGLQYYSLRGPEQSAEYRYKGRGNDFLHVYYDGLEDRGLAPLYINQGGQDTIVTGRRDFNANTHAITDAEYLSSYVYRQVFAPNFSLAVSSEVKSWAFLTHQQDGQAASVDLERYQNFESDAVGDQIRILHLPRLDYDTSDHSFGHSRLLDGGAASFSMMTRSEPGLNPSLDAARTDLYPHLSLPLLKRGWTLRPEVGLRETLYSNSQILGPTTPIVHNASLNRKAVETGVELLPPVLERDYSGGFLTRRFDVAVRHTIAPEVQYRYVAGVDNFNNVPRFDALDIYSDTNEMEYGLTQRWFIKSLKPHPCTTDEAANAHKEEASNAKSTQDNKNNPGIKKPAPTCTGDTQEWLSWYVGQKYFFDPTFGGAVVSGRRNIFTSTLDFSSIAYITSPRNTSPILSRLLLNTRGTTDMEWDVEYDAKAARMAANNIFTNYRHKSFFSSFGYALMNAPAESIVAAGQPIPVTNYDQMQLLLGYGAPTKPGLSVAGSGGLDINLRSLEYATAQTSYNFNCCGVSVEYRRFALGSVRNENMWSYGLTLTGIGTAGSLKRAERLF